jgi:hypothetical protein
VLSGADRDSGDARLAEPAVGVDARVDDADGAPNQRGGASPRKRPDPAAVDVADRLPLAVAVLVDRKDDPSALHRALCLTHADWRPGR